MELVNTPRRQNAHYFTIRPGDMYINLLKTKLNLLYIKNKFKPRRKHFPPLL